MARNHSVDEIPLLWKDRKRILGMPISFTRYSIDEDRLYTDIGLLNSSVNEMLLYRILDISSKQSFFQKIFGVGDITLFSADKSTTNLTMQSVKNPNEVRKLISRLVESAREKRKMRGREMFGVADVGMIDNPEFY